MLPSRPSPISYSHLYPSPSGIPGKETAKQIHQSQTALSPVDSLRASLIPLFTSKAVKKWILSYQNIRETYFAILDNVDEQDLGLPGRIF